MGIKMAVPTTLKADEQWPLSWRFVGADGRKQSGDTGANVLPEQDEDGSIQPDQALHGQRLKNTHRGRRALDDSREQGAHQNADEGILKLGEQVYEFRYLLQRFHSGTHSIHAHKQDTETGYHLAHVLDGGLFTEHNEAHADAHCNGS